MLYWSAQENKLPTLCQYNNLCVLYGTTVHKNTWVTSPDKICGHEIVTQSNEKILKCQIPVREKKMK